MSKQTEALKFFKFDKAVYLVTNGEDGIPNTRAMATAKSEDLKTIWMITGKNSDKYQELSKNPKCMIYATDDIDNQTYLEVRLFGKMELLSDAETIAAVWRDEYGHYFPSGKDDPNVCVLKFTTESGTLQSQAGKEKI